MARSSGLSVCAQTGSVGDVARDHSANAATPAARALKPVASAIKMFALEA